MKNGTVHAYFKKTGKNSWEYLGHSPVQETAKKAKDKFDKLNPNVITRLDTLTVW